MARESRPSWTLVGAAGIAGALAAAGVELLARAEPGMLPAAVQAAAGRCSHRAADYYRDWHATFTPDPELGFRCRPCLDVVLAGHPELGCRLRTNHRGLRTTLEEGPVDVVAIGDSFTFGYGVEERAAWPAQLARLSGLRVANLGISGFGPGSELAMLRREGLRLRPRLVVWQFFANDLLDAASFAAWQRSGQGDFLAWERARLTPSGDFGVAGGVGRSVRGLLHRWLVSYELAKYALRLGAYSPHSRPARWVRSGGAPMLLNSREPLAWADLSDARVQEGMALTTAALRAARDEARAAGADLLVVAAPTREAVYWRGAAGERQALEHNDRWLAQLCRQLDIPCLSLLPAFQRAAQREQLLYFGQDVHWNPAGHRLAAREIANFVRGQRL